MDCMLLSTSFSLNYSSKQRTVNQLAIIIIIKKTFSISLKEINKTYMYTTYF